MGVIILTCDKCNENMHEDYMLNCWKCDKLYCDSCAFNVCVEPTKEETEEDIKFFVKRGEDKTKLKTKKQILNAYKKHCESDFTAVDEDTHEERHIIRCIHCTKDKRRIYDDDDTIKYMMKKLNIQNRDELNKMMIDDKFDI